MSLATDPYAALVAASTNEDEPAVAAAARDVLAGGMACFYVDAVIAALREHEERLLEDIAREREDGASDITLHTLTSLRQTVAGLASVLDLNHNEVSAMYQDAVRDHAA